MEVTDEKVHDGKVMKQQLIGQILKTNNANKKIKLKSALGDGQSYDSNENFKYLQKKKIQPAIKVRKNSVVLSKNNKLRNKEVILQQYFDRWKKKRKYGHRWIAKTAFSSIKRMFGEHTCAIKFQHMVKGMFLNVSLYNMFRRLS